MARNSNNKAEWLHPPAEEEGLRRYVETIRERFGLVILAVLITTGAAVAYVITAPKTYEAFTDMLVTPVSGEDPTLTALPLIRESVDPTRDVETAALLVRNIDVAERVKEDIGSPDEAEALLDKVTAEPIAQSNFVSVKATEDSPEAAAELANAFATATVEDRTDQLHLAVDQQLEALGPEAPSATVTQLQTLANAPTPDIRIETAAQPPSSQASPRARSSASRPGSSRACCSASPARSPARSSTRACAARPSFAASTACPCSPAFPTRAAGARASRSHPARSPRREPRPTGRCARRSRPRPMAGTAR